MEDVEPSMGLGFGRFDAEKVPLGECGDMYELFLCVEKIRNLGIWESRQ
jgi:hypothetical protein